MKTNTALLGTIAALVLAAGATHTAADEQRSAADETVTVVVNMPDGRRVEIQERAQPSRTEGVSEGTTVRKVLPDGSVMSYGTGDGKKRRSGRSNRSSRSGGSGSGGVSTIGDATYSQDTATGGQDVRFLDSGMSAMLVGRTLYVWGAKLVQSDEAFEVIEGSRFAFDGVIAREVAADDDASEDPLFAPIKIEYPADTVVNLTLHARADQPDAPDRAVRSWTFRVR